MKLSSGHDMATVLINSQQVWLDSVLIPRLLQILVELSRNIIYAYKLLYITKSLPATTSLI